MSRLPIAILFICAVARAQVSSAVLRGVVTDPSSAAVAGAAVTASQKATGFTRKVLTDSRGQYEIQGLPPGAYTVTAQKDGFRDFEADGVALEVNQQARRDFQLTLGDARQRIIVEGAVSPVDSDDASHGYRMDNASITELPLESRNVVALVTLGPGAIPRQLGGFGHDVNNDVQEGTRGSVALNPPINGARST
jgi:hypothetical protein